MRSTESCKAEESAGTAEESADAEAGRTSIIDMWRIFGRGVINGGLVVGTIGCLSAQASTWLATGLPPAIYRSVDASAIGTMRFYGSVRPVFGASGLEW